jgi:small subunit ribosomal protein S2
LPFVSVDELITSGVHFGHKVSRWNPKMKPFIHGKRNLIHIIDLVETVKGLARGRSFLSRLGRAGQKIVFVGTKRQIKNVVQAEATRAGAPFVNERWLGGTLTNFTTIRSRLKRLEELEKLESEGTLQLYSKKHQSRLVRELRRIKKNLDGIRTLERLPGALVVIDPRKEYIAVKEANKLGIPIVAVLDTDCDPGEVDIPIPGNDDAMRSVQILLARLVDAHLEGKASYSEEAAAEARANEIDEDDVRTVRKRQGRQRQPPRRGQGGGGGGGGGGDRGGGGGGDRRDRERAAGPAPEAAASSGASAAAGAAAEAAPIKAPVGPEGGQG